MKRDMGAEIFCDAPLVCCPPWAEWYDGPCDDRCAFSAAVNYLQWTRVAGMLEDGYQPDQASADAALVRAADGGGSDIIVDALLAHGANPRAHLSLALARAARSGSRHAIKALVAAGARPADNGHEPIFWAAYRADNHLAMPLLLVDDAQGAVIMAAASGSTDALKIALTAGIDPTAHDSVALRTAARRGHLKAIDVLLAAGADPRAYRSSALYWAVLRGHVDAAQALTAAGADVLREDRIIGAVAHSRGPDMLRALLDAGADPDANDGQALIDAVYAGSVESVRALLDAGADPRAMSSRALHYATKQDRGEIAALLIAAGACPDEAATKRIEVKQMAKPNAKHIRARLALAGSSVRQVADQLGVSRQAVYGVISGERDTPRIRQAVVEAAKSTERALFGRPGRKIT